MRVLDFTRPGITTNEASDALKDPFDVKQTTQYFYGMGRSVQAASMKPSPLGMDMVVY